LSPAVTAVTTVVGLFLLGLVSPGPNFLVVLDATLSYGRRAGVVTGLGAAIGDAIYASCGLFGLAVLIEKGGYTLVVVKACGGFYLAGLGVKMMIRRGRASHSSAVDGGSISLGRLFWRGLATDLANPKTVVFFASIFAFAVNEDTSRGVRLAMLLGIVITSVLWRMFLSLVFSTTLIRVTYQRSQRFVEPILGAILSVLGLRLVADALAHIPHHDAPLV
jgi:amino acid exporter